MGGEGTTTSQYGWAALTLTGGSEETQRPIPTPPPHTTHIDFVSSTRLKQQKEGVVGSQAQGNKVCFEIRVDQLQAPRKQATQVAMPSALA